MDKQQRDLAVVESLRKFFVTKQTEIRKKNAKLFEGMTENTPENRQNVNDIMSSIMQEVEASLRSWDETPIEKLGNKSPKEHFESFTTIRDVLEFITIITKVIKHVYTPTMVENVKRVVGGNSDELARILENLKLDESNELNLRQQAAVNLALLSPDLKYLPGLKKILKSFDPENTSSESYFNLLEVYAQLGEPAIEVLISMVEESKDPTNGTLDTLGKHVLVTLGKVGANFKSDRIFDIIKKCFIKSEDKLFEINAFKFYGDTRAVAGLRGYVQKNTESMSLFEYEIIREAIVVLGGSVEDLDVHFESEDEDDDEDYDDDYYYDHDDEDDLDDDDDETGRLK